MSWTKQTLVNKEVIVDIPVRIWFQKYGTPEYWNALEKELNSEIREMEDFIRDHRSRDHYNMTVRDVYETVCKHCGYSYGVLDEPRQLTPTCCDEAMSEMGVEIIYKQGE